MKVKFAIVLLSTLAQRAVLAGSTSTRLGRTAQDAGHLRKTKKFQGGKAIAIQNGKTIDENHSPFIPGLRALTREDDSKIWNHGSYAVAASKSGYITLNVPQDTEVGDTLFLFLR
jgi:hypothetical protein